MIYKPREDSFLLQKQVKKFAEGRVLDMGTGSGVQAITAAESAEYVLAVDVNPEAVECARKKGLNVIQSDLFESVKGE